MLGNPVGARDHLAIFQKEVSVVHQCKCRQTEASSGRQFERPAGKKFVQLIVDVRMTNDLAARVGQQQAFDDSEFFATILVQLRKACPDAVPKS